MAVKGYSLADGSSAHVWEYTGRGHENDGAFWSLPVPSDTVVVEYWRQTGNQVKPDAFPLFHHQNQPHLQGRTVRRCASRHFPVVRVVRQLTWLAIPLQSCGSMVSRVWDMAPHRFSHQFLSRFPYRSPHRFSCPFGAPFAKRVTAPESGLHDEVMVKIFRQPFFHRALLRLRAFLGVPTASSLG